MTWVTLESLTREAIAMLLDQAITALGSAVAAPGGSGILRDRLGAVHDVLVAETVHSRDGWLDARARRTDRDRRRLAGRVAALCQGLSGGHEPGPALGEVRRLLVDLEHYRQRLHDLAFDSVGLELGGSE